MNLHPLDIVALVMLGLTTFQGLRRGLIRSIFDIIALIAAIALAATWHPKIAEFLTTTFHWPSAVTQVLSIFAIWIATYLVIDLVGGGLHRLIRSSIFGPLNFISGGLLGLGKGALLLGLFLQFALTLPFPKVFSETLESSQTVHWLAPLVQFSYPLLFGEGSPLTPPRQRQPVWPQPEPSTWKI